MTFESILIAAVVVLAVSMIIRHRRENPSVDMDHQAPNVHNVQMEGKVGPATAADKKEAAPAKKAPAKKKTTKKKTTKKKSTKKKAD